MRVRDFSNNELFSFCSNTLTHFKHFEQKQSKRDYLKIFEKDKNASTVLFGSSVICISVRKTYRKQQICWCRSYLSHFPNIRVARKRYKIYIESISKYCKNIESMEVTKLERNVLPFTGSLQRVLWDIHYVKSVQIRSYFWSAFFCTRTRNNFRIWTLFTQC